MAENKTFAEQRVTEPELSESDRIRQRIQDYKAQLSPNTLQVIQIMLEAQLKSGLMKPADLDALVMLRDEVNKDKSNTTHKFKTHNADYKTYLKQRCRKAAMKKQRYNNR